MSSRLLLLPAATLAAAPIHDALPGVSRVYLRGSTDDAEPGFGIQASTTEDLIKSCTDSANVKAFREKLIEQLEDYEGGDPPHLVWLAGGMAQGKSSVEKAVVEKIGLTEKVIARMDGDTLLHKIPEVETAKSDAGMTQAQKSEVIEGCRPVTKQVQWPLVSEAVEVGLNLYYESTTDRMLHKIKDGKVPGLSDKYAVDFGVTIVEDLDSIVEAAAKRGEKTGQIVPEHRVREKARGNELLYWQTMESMITDEIGIERRFFIQCRCTAFSPANVVEVTEAQIKEHMGQGRAPTSPEEARITICGKLVPLPEECTAERNDSGAGPAGPAKPARPSGLEAYLGYMVVVGVSMLVIVIAFYQNRGRAPAGDLAARSGGAEIEIPDMSAARR